MLHESGRNAPLRRKRLLSGDAPAYGVTALLFLAGEEHAWTFSLGIPLVSLATAVLLLAAIGRWLAASGARRRAKAVDRRLRSAVAGVSDERIVEPVAQVLERHASTRERLDVAAGRG